MGFYTGLRLKCELKPEFVPVIECLTDKRWDGWATVAEKFPQYPFLVEWSKESRCGFIPFGHDCIFLPDENWANSLEKDIWTFSCSLKNYNREIEKFLDFLPQMVISAIGYLKTEDDEDDGSIISI